MYYDLQNKSQQEAYKRMLTILGGLSRLFSVAREPYLYYRAHENIFAKYFAVDNNSRSDDSIDVCDPANRIGLGLKTWVGGNNQKIAEFGRLRPEYERLDGIELVRKISEYRNIRINTTKKIHGLNNMFYHVVVRTPGAMKIYESSYDLIDVDNIKIIDDRRNGKNTIYFNDGNHTYNFSKSKNTLYAEFNNLIEMDGFNVHIYDDPYAMLSSLFGDNDRKLLLSKEEDDSSSDTTQKICLRLYSTKADGTKFVAGKSGLNQWNGTRKTYSRDDKTSNRQPTRITPRDPNEMYIPFPKEDRERNASFFPGRDVSFDLKLPDGKWIQAKVCQDQGKAIMSNPNKELGKWLLRGVLGLPEGTVVTYETLKIHGIDSVIFTKLGDKKFSVDFCKLGTYEKFYNLPDADDSDSSDGQSTS